MSNTGHQDDIHLLELLTLANHSVTGWQDFLDALINNYNLNCCNLYLINIKSQSIRFQDWAGTRPSDIQLNEYMMNFFHSDTTHTLMLSGPPGKWLTPNIRDDKEQLESTAAYQKWAIPNNFIYSTGTTLFKNSDSICAIHFNRGIEQPPFTPDEEDRFTKLTPYLEKAVKLRLKIASELAPKSLIKPIINTFRLPVAVLNEFGEVIASNELMDDYISTSKSLSINKKLLSLNDKKDDFNLQFSVANIISLAKEKYLDYEPKVISISGENSQHTVGICELTEQSHDKSEVFVGAMIYLISQDRIRSISEDQLKSNFRLTQSEAKVCALLMKNTPIRQIAEIESKSINTVREQIQNCYIKSGVTNQLELINLIGCIPLDV
jgi:DNA-binding CsgD family transcriptional regulator